MQELAAESFEFLLEKANEIAQRYGFSNSYRLSFPAEIIYRGQHDSTWGLKTTLDRNLNIKSLKKYLYLCSKLQPIIETEYEKNHSELKIENIDDWLKDTYELFEPGNLLCWDYVVYLRHHGFPSFLLDWTQSIYIALGFAFFENSETDNRAIFMYIESPLNKKYISLGKPRIKRLPEYAKTSRRHFLQQSMYTMCYQAISNDLIFESYDMIRNPHPSTDQDVLVKFVIPSSERQKILRFLFSVNITPYSLAPTEDNLMKTLWLKEHLLNSHSQRVQ